MGAGEIRLIGFAYLSAKRGKGKFAISPLCRPVVFEQY
jgi:hypothetical protein